MCSRRNLNKKAKYELEADIQNLFSEGKTNNSILMYINADLQETYNL